MALTDIVCRREAGVARVEGVMHRWVWHSPAGFDWGCEGGGPADLALNILFEVTGDRDFAARHHQDSKREHVAQLPQAGGVIEEAVIGEWIAKRLRERELKLKRNRAGQRRSRLRSSGRDSE